jgi:hypothetical protein
MMEVEAFALLRGEWGCGSGHNSPISPAHRRIRLLCDEHHMPRRGGRLTVVSLDLRIRRERSIIRAGTTDCTKQRISHFCCRDNQLSVDCAMYYSTGDFLLRG